MEVEIKKTSTNKKELYDYQKENINNVFDKIENKPSKVNVLSIILPTVFALTFLRPFISVDSSE